MEDYIAMGLVIYIRLGMKQLNDDQEKGLIKQ